MVLEDNRDNNNNRKNGRNAWMSQSDIQLGQQDYYCQLVVLVNSCNRGEWPYRLVFNYKAKPEFFYIISTLFIDTALQRRKL